VRPSSKTSDTWPSAICGEKNVASANQISRSTERERTVVATPGTNEGKAERMREDTRMPTKPLNFDLVRDCAAQLPDVEESTIHGAPSLKVRGRLLTCPALHRSAEPNSLAVRIDCNQRAELLSTDPDVYYVTDHYVNHPTVLVRLSVIRRGQLRDLLRKAWEYVSQGRKA
jgi:hypothetical protein